MGDKRCGRQVLGKRLQRIIDGSAGGDWRIIRCPYCKHFRTTRGKEFDLTRCLKCNRHYAVKYVPVHDYKAIIESEQTAEAAS